MKQIVEFKRKPRLFNDKEFETVWANFSRFKQNTRNFAPALMEQLEHYVHRPSRKESYGSPDHNG